jgi:8-oxo-dGTP pyrophosphatase MutT (NUDIX family)
LLCSGQSECTVLAMLLSENPGPLIRDAATVVLCRKGAMGPEVLMGQRGAQAAFMPSKYVFPGGAVDKADSDAIFSGTLNSLCQYRLRLNCPDDAPAPATIASTALRELSEETGLQLLPMPNGNCGLQFIFRAITPAGRSRRFDARFFLADACYVQGDADNFSAASDELSHLHWIGISEARSLDLPFITEVVLAEIGNLLQDGAVQSGVPFFDNSGPVPTFRRLA